MIWHVFRDRGDPLWDGWDVRNQNGQGHSAVTLREVRAVRKVQLRRGAHPDKDKRPDSLRSGVPVGWSAYWFEVTA